MRYVYFLYNIWAMVQCGTVYSRNTHNMCRYADHAKVTHAIFRIMIYHALVSYHETPEYMVLYCTIYTVLIGIGIHIYIAYNVYCTLYNIH